MSSAANASRLQDESASGQSQSHQQVQQCLWDNACKKGKKSLCRSTFHQSRVRMCESNNSADTKASEGRGAGASGVRAEIPLKPLVKTMMRHLVTLQPMEVYG